MMMCYDYFGICPVCGKKNTKKNEHHKRKKAVWGEGETIFVCEYPCHLAIEEIVRQKENALLRQYPEIYDDTLKDFLNQKINPYEVVKGKGPRKKRRRRK